MISLEDAIKQIRKANPFMGGLLDCDDSLEVYAKKLTTYKPSGVHLERQKPYLDFIKKKVYSLFTEEEVRINFDEGMILDTTDHHNLLNYPSTLGAHLISRFNTILNRKEFGDYYVLDCGNVPFFDAIHKRGIEIGGKHINLYPKSAKNKLISRYPLHTYDLMDCVKKSGQKLNDEEVGFLNNLQSLINKIDFSKCKKLSDQMIKINYYLWLELFDEKIRNDVRRCITLEHDEILIDYLSGFLLENNNIIWKSFFDKTFRDEVIEKFNGIYGAWNYSGDNTGTYFFWGFNENDGKEYRMEIQNEKLINPDGLIKDINLTPEDISRSLKEGKIIPSIFTKFALIAFYMGAKTMGGPGQTEYLNKFHNAWMNLLKEKDSNEYELIKEVTVLNFNCGDIAFHREGEKIIREYGFDVAKNHTFTLSYLQELGKTSFKYLLYPLIPISYYRLTPANERQEIDFKENDLYQGFNWLK